MVHCRNRKRANDADRNLAKALPPAVTQSEEDPVRQISRA